MLKLANSILVIFGITGDLARRKLLPALYALAQENLLPLGFTILGISRRNTTTEDILSILDKHPRHDEVQHQNVMARLKNTISILDIDIGKSESYHLLAEKLAQADLDAGHLLNRLFYLAIPASLFSSVIERLSQSDINNHQKTGRESRFLIEKPFGSSLKTAQELIDLLNKHFEESQIYRIDHYLAKETAQNILAFRFENPLFKGVWNNKHISHILVTASEKIGIEGRTVFYEQMGALRDLFQSHLLQLVALVTMDMPEIMDSEHIHQKKEALLSCIQAPATHNMNTHTVRAQYKTYRDETGIPEASIETYAAVRLAIDTDTWRGVPILVRTGKALSQKVTEITIIFSEKDKKNAHPKTEQKNCLTLRIQPDEGIAIDFAIKKPGFEDRYEQVQLDFCYYGMEKPVRQDAYKRVLFDALRGDATLFATNTEVLECWRISEPILDAWHTNAVPLDFYENGSEGPASANILAKNAGTEWLPDTHTVCQIVKTRDI